MSGKHFPPRHPLAYQASGLSARRPGRDWCCPELSFCQAPHHPPLLPTHPEGASLQPLPPSLGSSPSTPESSWHETFHSPSPSGAKTPLLLFSAGDFLALGLGQWRQCFWMGGGWNGAPSPLSPAVAPMGAYGCTRQVEKAPQRLTSPSTRAWCVTG